MISALVSGDLVADPVARTTQAGKPFTTATLRVPAGEDAIFVGVAAFDATAAQRLGQMRKGASIAAVGTLEQTTWTDKTGGARTGWRLTASEVLTAYAATKKRRQAEASGDE